ncbi:DUF6629 family protein [Streptomyces lavendulae]|uniref:DUF6629 family protein n=1 Tax=Streptomyces lavendulae TaxID=1914 RepID=UPI003F4CEAF4
MGWSTAADRTPGTVVAAVGVVCVARVRRARDLPVAAPPLLLGAHQLIEAAVRDAGGCCGPATTAWAVIALPVLPVWVPLGVLAAGPGARRRLWVPVAVGTATAAVLAYCLATGPVTAEVRGRLVGYGVDVPYAPLVLSGYLGATLGALLLTGDRRLRVLGRVRRPVGPGGARRGAATGSGRPVRRGGRRRRRRDARRRGMRSAG